MAKRIKVQPEELVKDKLPPSSDVSHHQGNDSSSKTELTLQEKKRIFKEKKDAERLRLLSVPANETPLIDCCSSFKSPQHKQENLDLMLLFLKRLLFQWQNAVSDGHRVDPKSLKGSSSMPDQLSLVKKTAENLRPFFLQLKQDKIPDDVLLFILEICSFLQRREYMKANDAYLRLAIGNAPWPIGVTMVGIHERSAREKIHSNQVAHVLNDESQRKWIQSIKRLMTHCQAIYPPDDLSKAVG